MGDPIIYIEDSVSALLGYPKPLEGLEDFVALADLEAARRFIEDDEKSIFHLDCLDGDRDLVPGMLVVRRAGPARIVSFQIRGEKPVPEGAYPTNGALADGTVIWTLDVRKSEIRVEHRSGPDDELVSFVTGLNTWMETVFEEDRPLLETQVRRCIADGSDIHVTIRVLRAGGEMRVVEAFGRSVRQGNITTQIVGMSIDVTSRVAEMQAMATETARLEHALEASNMGIWEWNIDTDEVLWSKNVAQIFGVSVLESASTYEAFTTFVHPEDRAEAEKAVDRFLSGESSEYLVNHRIIRPDGEVRWLEGRGSLIRGQDGAPLVLLGTVWDRTALRTERQRVHEMEMELVRASNRLKLASEAAGIGLWEISLNTGTHSWDPQMCRLCGLDRDGYTGTGVEWIHAIHPEDARASNEELLRTLEDGHGTSSFRVILPDGAVRHLVSFGQVVVEPGMGPRLVGLCMDVTERREAELRERNRNRVLEAMVSTASVQEVLTVLVNVLEEEEVHSRFGFMLVDASGKVLENAAAPSLPDFYLEASHELAIAVGNGSCGSAAALLEPVIVEDVLVHPHWEAYRDIAESAGIRACWSIPIIAPQGQLYGTLAMYYGAPRLRDDNLLRRMTAAADFAALAIERKHAEVERRNRELLLESMGKIAGMGGWELDLLSGNRTWTSEIPKILDLDPDAKVADVLALYSPDSVARLQAAMQRASADGEPWSLELDLITPLGRHVWIRSEGRAQAVNGRVVRLFGAVQDITATKKAEAEYLKLQEQLLHVQKLESIGRLAGGVAHDFNNIVSVILGHAELAMETAPVGSELMEDLNEIRLAAERSASLTHQLLAFARKQPMSPKVVNINDTIAGMVNMLRRLIGGQLALSWDSEPDLWSVYVDPAQIDQILANLCVNARDAIGARGTVKIATTNVILDAEGVAGLGDCEPGAYVCLSVADDGSGMPREVLENIFEPFFTTKGVGMGTGLGLATVYGIVKQNSGGIRVDSKVGVGTRFDIYLPREGDPLDPKSVEVSAKTPGRLFSTVLLVDDEPTLLKVATRMLEGLGHEVYAALGPKEAMRLAAEIGHIDVLLTDVIMPEMNGKRLSEQLVSLHPEMTVVLMSGYTAEVLEDEGVKKDMFFLQKPFSLHELSEIVSDALSLPPSHE